MVLIFRSLSIYRFNFQLLPTFGFASVSPPDLATVPIPYQFIVLIFSSSRPLVSPVWVLRICQPIPYQFIVLIFSSSRPLVALCDSSGPGTAFMSVSFISLSTGEQVQKTSADFFRDFIFTVRTNYELKRSLTRDFQLQVYFINRFPLGPEQGFGSALI